MYPKKLNDSVLYPLKGPCDLFLLYKLLHQLELNIIHAFVNKDVPVFSIGFHLKENNKGQCRLKL